MTDHDPAQREKIEKSSVAKQAVGNFINTYDRFQSRFAPNKSNGRTWQEYDDEADTLNDLKDDLSATESQTILEGSWPADEQLDDARRDALKEIYIAENGELTQAQIAESLTVLRKVILDFQHPDYTKKELSELNAGIIGTAEQKANVLSFIEDRISEYNAFPGDGEKMKERNLLRIARIKIDEMYRSARDGERELQRQQAQEERDRQAAERRSADTASAREAVAQAFQGDHGGSKGGNVVRSMSGAQIKSMLEEHERQTGEKNPLLNSPDIPTPQPATESATSPDVPEEDPETTQLRELGFGNTAEEQAENLKKSRKAKEELDRTAKERRERITKRRESEEVARKEVAEAFTPSEVVSEPTPAEEITTESDVELKPSTPESQPTKVTKPELTPEEIAKRQATLEKEKLKIKQAALRKSVEILRLVPRPIKEQLLQDSSQENPLLSSSQEAFEVDVDTSKINPNIVRNIESKLLNIGAIGHNPAGPSFWDQVENPRGSSELARYAQETRDLLTELLEHLKKAQK